MNRKRNIRLDSLGVFTAAQLRILGSLGIETIVNLGGFSKSLIYFTTNLGSQTVAKIVLLQREFGFKFPNGERWSQSLENRVLDEIVRLDLQVKRKWEEASNIPLSKIIISDSAREGLTHNGVMTLGDLVDFYSRSKKARVS